ncbi:MAG: 50S ribosomal protein L21 [Endozoicomonadaceae bacterium]|nr:50S ribosomal protein L21 [Endozoicomonadaceae bacterium]MCY4328816.1 50S ribosomal protein L21 [Endozoicomonadaceae bacterium]
MYAIIQTGGKQYRTAVGDTLRVEKLETPTGETVEIDKVLMIGKDDNTIEVGKPALEGAKVVAEVVSHGRGKKINIIKFKRRKHHMKRMGHRQWFTEIKVTAINS